jgi:hypothetical protein
VRRSRHVLFAKCAGFAIVASIVGVLVGARRAARAFVPPPYAGGGAETSIEGTYSVEGTEPGGNPEPGGTATIVHLDGPRYEMSETINGATYHATCLRRASVLGCGWGRQDVMRGIAVYTGGAVLEGEWWESGAPGLGREVLVGGDAVNGGTWTILEGRDATAGAASYTGTAISRANGLIQTWSWTVSSTTWYGWGVRLGGVVAVGFNLVGTCGVVVYEVRPGGGRLEGVWVDPGRPNALGTEILVRK